MLEPADIITQFVPGDIFWGPVEEGIQVAEIRPDIGAIVFQGMVSKAAEGDHLPESI